MQGAKWPLVPGRAGQLGPGLRPAQLLWRLHSHHWGHWLDPAGADLRRESQALLTISWTRRSTSWAWGAGIPWRLEEAVQHPQSPLRHREGNLPSACTSRPCSPTADFGEWISQQHCGFRGLGGHARDTPQPRGCCRDSICPRFQPAKPVPHWWVLPTERGAQALGTAKWASCHHKPKGGGGLGPGPSPTPSCPHTHTPGGMSSFCGIKPLRPGLPLPERDWDLRTQPGVPLASGRMPSGTFQRSFTSGWRRVGKEWCVGKSCLFLPPAFCTPKSVSWAMAETMQGSQR